MKYCFLAVDDEPLALQDLTNALHTAEPEAQVHDFTDPEEALAAVHAGTFSPQVAFLDIQMRGWTGLDLAVELRKLLPALEIINTPYAIILGMVYNFLPFMVLPIYNVLAKIDPNVINAARDLGANSVQTFLKVIFPLSIPGVISGITMVFVPALTTFVISDLLGGGKILLIGNVIEQSFKQNSNWHVGSGLSLVLMVFIIASMALVAKYDKEEGGSAF